MSTESHTLIDHLIITATTLEEGVKYVQEKLGVSPQAGGIHEKMGTHNCLLRLGESLYLEVIAINPMVAKPERARWFDMDSPDPVSAPQLRTWVARTEDVDIATKGLESLFGKVSLMSRAELHWRITIPDEGRLLFDGVCPYLIQWLAPKHPASSLSDSGCSLISLEGYHPRAKEISATLESIHFSGPFAVQEIGEAERPRLVAHIQTPEGVRRI